MYEKVIRKHPANFIKPLMGIILTGFCAVAIAGIETRTVQAEGSGTTRQEAVEAALSDAVGQVTGMFIKSETASASAMSTANISSANEKGEVSKTSAALLETVQRSSSTRVKGNVKSFTVVDVKKDDSGLYNATVEADVSVYRDDGQSSRRKIAVLPFYYTGTTERVIGFDKRLRQAAVDYLTSSRHFAVVDKDYTHERLKELESLKRPDVKLEERARIGNSLGTDYILVGDISKFDLKPQSIKVPYTNEVQTHYEGPVSISWRLIEGATGQILASASSDQRLRLKSIDDVESRGASEGRKIAERLSDIIYPIAVLDCSGDRLTLAQGGETMKVGSRYKLIKYGKVLTDPYTQEKLARDEMEVGEVEISDVSPKISHATVLSTRTNLEGLAPREYILRAIPTSNQTKQKSITRKPKW